MVEFWEGKYASRKFIDLLWKSCSKWAVWDPASVAISASPPPFPLTIVDQGSLQIGDYGTVEKETGHFEREGNIFTTPELAEIVKGHEAKLQSSSEDVIFATSLNTRKVEVGTGFTANAQVAQVALKASHATREGGTVLTPWIRSLCRLDGDLARLRAQ